MSIPHVMYKGHGTGNDFVLYLDADGNREPAEDEVRHITDRHFGIGGDGLIRIAHPRDVSDLSDATVRSLQQEGVSWFMDYRNADGSLAQMCGNGTRVSALLLHKLNVEGLSDDSQVCILGTRAGVKRIRPIPDDEILGHQLFQVDMGPWSVDTEHQYTLTLQGNEGQAQGSYADLGNPHIVVVAQNRTKNVELSRRAQSSSLGDIAHLDLTHAPVVTPALQSGQNVEFLEVLSLDQARNEGSAAMRVHERGVGETLSCGTGLCASAVTLRSLTGINHWTIRVPGGVLRIDVETDRVLLTGAAQIVGTIELADDAMKLG